MCSEGAKGRHVAVPGSLRRREFLTLGGVGLAGVALAGGSLAGTSRALAQEVASSESTGALRHEFESAAAEYGVPVEVLLAVGYVNTRWEMPDLMINAYEQGEAPGRGTFGIMALVQNPTANTLGDAAALSGIPEATLKSDRAANIRGGAALLAEASGAGTAATMSRATDGFADTVTGAAQDMDAMNPASVRRFNETVSGAVEDLTRSLDAVQNGVSGGSAVAGIGGGELYAEQVRNVLQRGVSDTISSGERVTLAPAGV